MHRLRHFISAIYRRKIQREGEVLPVPSGDIELMRELVLAIRNRELNGQTTSLRQLHNICDMTQQQALAVLSQMCIANIASIEQNVSDEFESLVVLSEDAVDRIAEAQDRDAA